VHGGERFLEQNLLRGMFLRVSNASGISGSPGAVTPPGSVTSGSGARRARHLPPLPGTSPVPSGGRRGSAASVTLQASMPYSLRSIASASLRLDGLALAGMAARVEACALPSAQAADGGGDSALTGLIEALSVDMLARILEPLVATPEQVRLACTAALARCVLC
jgi:hypothetical protein